MNANLWVLVSAQALSMSVAPLMVFIGGIVGQQLAPDDRLATLPVALIVVGTALAVVPVTQLMHRFGRKTIFLGGALLAFLSAITAAYALQAAIFSLFCFSAIAMGSSLAIAQQYRFAAMESMPAALSGVAASRVLLGGLVAAFLGPELVVYGPWAEALLGLDSVASELPRFSGAFILLGGLALGAFCILLFYRNTVFAVADVVESPRAFRALFGNPLLWLAVGAAAIGYAMMSFMMTATPVNMHRIDGHSLLDTKWVIQSHIMAMFLPSLFSGRLIQRFGHRIVIGMGVTAYLVTVFVGLAGQQLMHYWVSLVLLGIGWNFLFVAGTSLLPQCYQENERFKVQSVNEFAVFSCQALAALASGWVVVSLGWSVLLTMCLGMILVLSYLIWLNRQEAAIGV